MTCQEPITLAVNELVLSEEAFFFDKSLDLLSVISMDGYFKRINPVFTQTLGYSEAELLASPFLNFVHPDDHWATLREMEKLNTGIPTLNFENRYRTKDGCYRWLVWTGSPQIDRGVMYCVARDMTELKQTQAALQRANLELEQRVTQRTAELEQVNAALRESEEFKQRMLESSTDCIKVLDIDGRLLYINQNGLCLMELDNFESVCNADWTACWQDEHRACALEAIAAAKAGRIGRFQGYCATAKGTPKWWDVVVTPMQDADGQVIQVLYVSRDITERKQAEEAMRRSEQRYRTLFERMEDGFCVIKMLFDANNQPIDYRYLECNPAFEQQTGLQQAVGKTARQLLPNLEEFWFETYGRVALTGEPVRFENGSEAMNRWFEVYAFPIDQPDKRKVALLLKNISDRKQSEIALRENEDRLRLAIASAQLGTWDWNLVTGELKWDIGCKAMFGLPPHANSNLEMFFTGLHPDDNERLQKVIQQALNPESGGYYDTEYRTIGIEDKVERWLRAKGQAYFDPNGKPLRFSGTVLNITQEKQAQAQLIHDAFHDSLTGLPNRALFVERLERALLLTKRHSGYRFAVLFLDMDRFKVINDSLGHLIGDQLLTALARRLEMCIRAGDTVARLGGDEFTILLDDIQDLNDVIDVVDSINVTLAETFNLGGQEVFTSASIGIAYSTTTYNKPEEIIRDADIAMYRAKALGKARYEIFDASMYAQATQLLQLEMDLRRAIEGQEFQLYYQPIVSLETYKIIGFEALVRWQHPELGFISPDKFVPLAEETGLIVPIGYWVLHQACRQMRDWQLQFPTNPPLTISVNISSKQFSQPNLIEKIRQILQDTGLEASSLKLEITETVLMENSDSATALFVQLQQMDIQLHLDDFGIGYSSLSYLHRFPSSALKIDRSFVAKIGTNGENLEIIQAIISLAHSLNINVIAEGVETIEQLTHLQTKKCPHAQGYIFSQPLDSTSVAQLIASNLHFQV